MDMLKLATEICLGPKYRLHRQYTDEVTAEARFECGNSLVAMVGYLASRAAHLRIEIEKLQAEKNEWKQV